jgi:hypothetical protein
VTHRLFKITTGDLVSALRQYHAGRSPPCAETPLWARRIPRRKDGEPPGGREAAVQASAGGTP